MNRLTESELRLAYSGRRVLVTGHTGFKGGWLTLWLHHLGAQVTGYALPPATDPSFFRATNLEGLCQHVLGDIRDQQALRKTVASSHPEFVFHLAAQPLVRASYQTPVETIETNILGTAHLLEAIRQERLSCAVVVVTSDKCYENREWVYGYRETDRLGGRDIYSMSKAGTELLVSAYRSSFFPPDRISEHGVALATARAGNVIGGGDWAVDRIVPDAIRALSSGRPVPVRNPNSVRPWQHVAEPLCGYLTLGRHLDAADEKRSSYCDAWNFGPGGAAVQTVVQLVEAIIQRWGSGSWTDEHDPRSAAEARRLQLSIEKSREYLHWSPRWELGQALDYTVEWYRAFHPSAAYELRALTQHQLVRYMETAFAATPDC